jgi:ADP-ribose pyrophosphatase YjhB (NUDIX family)
MSTDQPAIQLIANVVLENADGRVLLVRYDDAERDGDTPRWWIPAGELAPYEHPDDVARAAIDGLGVAVESLALARVDSFRGRRGWHLSFDYRARGAGEPSSATPAAWHDPADLPPTAHGSWERDVITAVLAT